MIILLKCEHCNMMLCRRYGRYSKKKMCIINRMVTFFFNLFLKELKLKLKLKDLQCFKDRIKIMVRIKIGIRIIEMADTCYSQSLAKKFEEQSSKQEAYQKVLAGEAMLVENRGYVEFVSKIKYSAAGSGESRMRVMKVMQIVVSCLLVRRFHTCLQFSYTVAGQLCHLMLCGIGVKFYVFTCI